jgi:hypothetical protein
MTCLQLLRAAFAAGLFASCASTSAEPGIAWGVDAEVYPAGAVIAARGEKQVSDHAVVAGRVGYNFTERGDFGEHDDESGGGPGFGFTYRRWLGEGFQGWFWGARADLFWLEVDWEDDLSGGGKREGTSDIIVLEPVGQGGYSWTLPAGARLDLAASLGVEINVDTDGEDVGEGTILLFGLTWSK